MVGSNAHGFAADWSNVDVDPVPTFAESVGFIDDYEAARGRRSAGPSGSSLSRC
jgi:hypothetical protein